ncbi:MAG: methyltransferase domain-containing protein [Rhodobacteraceae bacterium]|nr:methyltransferase domain-containing protein [Paracoccaceae bacterium]
MANDHKFWDRMAKRYAKSAVSDEVAYQEKLHKTRAVLTADSTVLEFGCGTGSTAITLAPEVQDYLATDISGEMLGIARGKADGINNLRFEQKHLEEITPPESGFDAVLAHSILHLLPDKEAAIARAFALLKPGGVFISSTTCMAKGGFLKPLIWAGNKMGLLPMVKFFSADALVDAVNAADFTIEDRWQPTPKAALFMIARKPL